MSVLGSLIDAGVSYSINQDNLRFQQDALDRNEALTRESWARDDNAVQRRVADLKEAGLSPVLAAGSAAGNTAPIKAVPKESKFQTNFASSSLASDINDIQDIKAKREQNKGLVLANEEQDLKNRYLAKQLELIGLDIEHYGESPFMRALSAAVEDITGIPAGEWLKRLGERLGLRDDEVTPDQEEAVTTFSRDFFMYGQKNHFVTFRAGRAEVTSTGEGAIAEFLKDHAIRGVSVGEMKKLLVEGFSEFRKNNLFQTYDGGKPLAGAGAAGGAGYAW